MNKLLTLAFLLVGLHVTAQKLEPTEDKVLYNLYLKCNEGGVFSNQEVVFTNLNDKSTIKCTSDVGGVVHVYYPLVMYLNTVSKISLKVALLQCRTSHTCL